MCSLVFYAISLVLIFELAVMLVNFPLLIHVPVLILGLQSGRKFSRVDILAES